MKTSSLQFNNGKWSAKFPTELDSDSTWIFVAAGPKMQDFAPLKDLKKNFPKSVITGCSSSGEIFGDLVFDSTFSVSICKFEKTKLKLAEADIVEASASEQVGKSIATQLKGENLAAVFLVSDGLNVNGTELTRGLNSSLNTKTGQVSICGGLAGDGADFKSTYTISSDNIQHKKVIAVGFYGTEISVGTGSIGGWDPFGPVRHVTKSEGNVLAELDGKPALDLYKEYLGEQASQLPGSALLFPLSITFDDRKDIVRTILNVDEAKKTMTFAGDIPMGAEIQLMKANFARLVEGAEKAGSLAASLAKKDQETLAVAVSCVGRRLVLGEKIDEETEGVRALMPTKTSMIGFYSYGEISPSGVHGCELHNQTMTVSVFQEK